MADQVFEPSLRDEILRTPGASNTSRVAISGMTRKETVLELPGDATDDQKFAWFFHLVIRGTSKEEDKASWRTFMLSLIRLAFPVISGAMISDQPRLYDVQTIDADTLEALTTYVLGHEAWNEVPLTDTQARADEKVTLTEMYPDIVGLPSVTSDNITGEVRKCLTVEAMYGYVSLVLFLAGKTITEQNRGAITTRRPNAIERKYELGSVPCLTGDLKMSNVAHRLVHVAFVTLNHARKSIFQEVARFSNETGDIGVEVAATTTRLMAYSGMQHVVLIDKFLSSEPDAAIIPILASSLVFYGASLRALRKTPVELRPFYKLIHGDTVQEFNRKHVEPLMVVAIRTEAETNPTLMNYNLPENNAEIMAAFNRYKVQTTQ